MTDGNFAQRLKEIMKEKKISGKELAEGANTTEATISRYVSGKRSPEILEVLKNAAKFLGVSTDYLLGLTNNPFEKGSLPAEVKELLARYIRASDADKKIIWAVFLSRTASFRSIMRSHRTSI